MAVVRSFTVQRVSGEHVIVNASEDDKVSDLLEQVDHLLPSPAGTALRLVDGDAILTMETEVRAVRGEVLTAVAVPALGFGTSFSSELGDETSIDMIRGGAATPWLRVSAGKCEGIVSRDGGGFVELSRSVSIEDFPFEFGLEVPQARAVSVHARRAGGKTWCAVTLSRAVQELCVVTLDSDRLAVLELGPVPPPPPDWPPRFGQFWDQEDLLEAKEDEMVEQHMGHYPVDAHGYHSTNIASHDWTKERESGDSRIYLGVTVQGAVHHGSTVRIFDSRGAWWTEYECWQAKWHKVLLGDLVAWQAPPNVCFAEAQRRTPPQHLREVISRCWVQGSKRQVPSQIPARQPFLGRLRLTTVPVMADRGRTRLAAAQKAHADEIPNEPSVESTALHGIPATSATFVDGCPWQRFADPGSGRFWWWHPCGQHFFEDAEVWHKFVDLHGRRWRWHAETGSCFFEV